MWQFRHGAGEILALPAGDFRGKGFRAAFGIGFSMTRPPRMGAAGKPEVAVRKLVESKAIRETSSY